MMRASFDLASELGIGVVVLITEIEIDVRVTSTEVDPKEEYVIIVEVPIEVWVIGDKVSKLGGIGDVVLMTLLATPVRDE